MGCCRGRGGHQHRLISTGDQRALSGRPPPFRRPQALPDPVDLTTMQALMTAAIAEANVGWHEGGIPIGAVLAREDGDIVARGHNRRVQNGDPTAHGETECIRNAGRRRDWRHLTLVTTLSPCPMCAGTAVLLGFRRVVIGERRSYQGAEAWLLEAGIEVVCLDDPACMNLMGRMLQQKPDLWLEDIGR